MRISSELHRNIDVYVIEHGKSLNAAVEETIGNMLECKEESMHTFEGKSCRIYHNSDMGGEVHICDKNSDKELIIEAQDILDFVASYIRTERIGTLEQMSTDDILHLK